MALPTLITIALDKLRCFFGRHLYAPLYEVRQANASNGRYLYKEFRYKCECCERKTRWLRWRRLEAFEAKHKPNWSHSRLHLKSL